MHTGGHLLRKNLVFQQDGKKIRRFGGGLRKFRERRKSQQEYGDRVKVTANHGHKMACMLGWTVRRKKMIHKGWPGGATKM